MKILHVAETIKGGVATIIQQLIDGIDACNIIIIPKDQEDEISINRDGNKKIIFKRKGRGLKGFFELLKVFVRTFTKEDPDYVYLHSTFAGVICRLILPFINRSRKVKVIYCPHAFSFLMAGNVFKQKMYAFIERKLSNVTDKIVCTSNFERNEAVKHGLDSEKLVVIYNSVREPSLVSDLNVNPYNKEGVNLVFIGRFDYQKGFDKVIELSRLLPPNYNVYAIGDFVNDKLAVNRDIGNIQYLGWVKNRDLGRYYYYADVILMPSRWESFGLVAVEAQSYGTPVIGSNLASLPEVIMDRKTGFLIKGDFIKETLLLLNKEPDFNAMDKECVNFYQDNFSSKVMIDQVNFLLKSI